MPKDLIRLNNSQACAACNPLHRRRVLMVSLSFTEVIRKHVSFQPPETCSLHAVWAERPAPQAPPPDLTFFCALNLSFSLAFSFPLYFDLPSCSFDSSEGNYDESGWVGTKSAFPSSNERTNYSLPFFILSFFFSLFFRWCPRPCCFCKC